MENPGQFRMEINSKFLEQTNARCPDDDPMRDYDFAWMWQELGVTDLRS